MSSDVHVWCVRAGATLDADWRDDTVFATCSNDGSIAVCKMGSDKALKTWPGDPSTEVRVTVCVVLKCASTATPTHCLPAASGLCSWRCQVLCADYKLWLPVCRPAGDGCAVGGLRGPAGISWG